MSSHYKAVIYCEEEIIASKHGDDVDELYLWMLTQATVNYGSIHGEVVEVKTDVVVRKFCTTSME